MRTGFAILEVGQGGGWVDGGKGLNKLRVEFKFQLRQCWQQGRFFFQRKRKEYRDMGKQFQQIYNDSVTKELSFFFASWRSDLRMVRPKKKKKN